MDWMYKNPKPDKEEYLLGRKIDKFIESMIEDTEEKKNDQLADDKAAIFNERIKANIEMDMAAKRREDPLFQIRQKEEDARKKIVQNPVKMKQLQQLIAQREASKQVKAKHKKKKKKKKTDSGDELMGKYLQALSKKHGGERPNNDAGNGSTTSDKGSDSDSDNTRHKTHRSKTRRHKSYLTDKDNRDVIKHRTKHVNTSEIYTNFDKDESRHKRSVNKRDDKRHWKTRSVRENSKEFKHEKYTSRKEYRSSPEVSDDSDEYRRTATKKSKHKDKFSSEIDDRFRSKSSTSQSENKYENREGNRHGYDRQKDESTEYRRDDLRHSPSFSRDRKEKNRNDDRFTDEECKEDRKEKSYGLQLSKNHHKLKSSKLSPDRSLQPSYDRSGHNDSKSSEIDNGREKHRKSVKQMTEDEKAKKLSEMIDNAKQRDEDRIQNIHRYNEEDESEKHDTNKSRAGFLNSMMVDHVTSSSVEDRIKRNKYNVQRRTVDLNKDFTKR